MVLYRKQDSVATSQAHGGALLRLGELGLVTGADFYSIPVSFCYYYITSSKQGREGGGEAQIIREVE
jgi:hypothetical protein